MPIGSAKIGVLGAGLVPGGTQTFNASGTFTVPPGVKKVNITGKGGTGNPGNAGNSGNPGNFGNGGGGGGGGVGRLQFGCGYCTLLRGAQGGWAYTREVCSSPYYGFYTSPTITPQFPIWTCNSSSPCPTFRMGGNSSNICPYNGPGANTLNNAQSGNSGNAGTAGTAGNPGNTGNSSTGLNKTFTGGAGGNAGVAGAAGNAGSGGTGGGRGGAEGGGGGSAGNGAGSGGSGTSGKICSLPLCGLVSNFATAKGGSGGGGAGVTNCGSSGANPSIMGNANPNYPLAFNRGLSARGGNFPSVSAPINNQPFPLCAAYPNPPTTFCTNMTGGMGGVGGFAPAGCGIPSVVLTNSIFPPSKPNSNRTSLNSFTPAAPNEIFRSGAGGGGGRGWPSIGNAYSGKPYSLGGGGGGGGRGNAGGAGGTSSAPSGSAATPSTFNCVPVTPGSPYPITVASPGGQVVISWNPQ